MELASGAAVILPAAGKSFDPTQIPKAVKNAGFSPGGLEATIAGVLTKKDENLVLQLPHGEGRFVLAGGPRAEELESRGDLVGRRVRVTGNLHPYHADKPPGLTVKTFEVVASSGS